MRHKIFSIIKEFGFKNFLIRAVNFSLSRVFGIKITRKSFTSRKLAKQVFGRSKLNYSKEGFWYLDPMPSQLKLNSYYSLLHSKSELDRENVIKSRDCIHYQILKEYLPNVIARNKVFLNFGAGHNGISNLCWLQGMDIINVELNILPSPYKERWKTKHSISEISSNSVDIIYGSHSLEHVQNIQSFKSEARRILKPGGYIFLEVPNGNCSSNGAQLNKVDIPHTYYFEKNFFNDWLDEILICAVFQSQTNEIQNWNNFQDESGDIIRVLGSLK